MADPQALPRVVVLNDLEPGYYREFPEALEPLAGLAEVVVHTHESRSNSDVLERLSGAFAAIDIRALSTFDAATLEALADLRVIVVRGTTAPLVDVPYATSRGVLVCNTPYQSTAAVSEYSLALLLAAVRRIPAMDAELRRGNWQSRPGYLIAGKTLGVIGLGMIGQAMCRLGAALGMRVVSWSPSGDAARAAACGSELLDLDMLLQTSDAVSLHLRLSETTRGVIGRRELSLLKNGAILVNTARGKLVDQEALVDELRSGRIIGALDVFVDEPLAKDHPLIGLENVIVTPHAAWATDEVRASRARVPVENVAAAMNGCAQNILNPAALEHACWRDLLKAPQAA